MYLQHWKLSETPFPSALSASGYCANPAHEEALARMRFLVDRTQGLGLLLGGGGSGKSLLLEVLAAEVRRSGGAAVRIALSGLEPVELLAAVAVGLSLNPDRDATLPQLWSAVRDRLIENRCQKLATVVMLDDADEATLDVRDQVLRLVQLGGLHASRLALILSSRLQSLPSLGRRLLELADLRIDLSPWELADTEAYLHHALARAGRTEPAFEPEAVQHLHSLTQGNPRAINQVADLAMVATAAQGLSLVDSHTVDAVVNELGVTAFVEMEG